MFSGAGDLQRYFLNVFYPFYFIVKCNCSFSNLETLLQKNFPVVFLHDSFYT